MGHPPVREYTGFGGPTAGPIWRYFMEEATAGECPAFETPETLPELSAYDSGHTTSGGFKPSTGEENEYEEYEGEEYEEEEEAPEEEETEEAPAEEAPEEVTQAPAGGGVAPEG